MHSIEVLRLTSTSSIRPGLGAGSVLIYTWIEKLLDTVDMEARKMLRYAGLMSVLAATFMFSGSSVQSCNSTIQVFSPCFPAAQGTTPPLPSTACCRVMQSADGPMCLCASVAHADIPDVNMQAAVMIAKHCKIFGPENTTACGSEYQVVS